MGQPQRICGCRTCARLAWRAVAHAIAQHMFNEAERAFHAADQVHPPARLALHPFWANRHE